MPKRRSYPQFPATLLARMEPQANGCIYFTGNVDPVTGYGRLYRDGRKIQAHRAAYEHFVGPIPDGMTIDHECHNRDEACAGGPSCLHRRCVNWEHLAPKPQRENLRASRYTEAAINAAKTHCKRGHEFTEENTRVSPSGRRICRECARSTQRDRRAKATV